MKEDNYLDFNSPEKFEDFDSMKKRLEIMEIDLTKSQNKIKKLESQLKKSQDILINTDKNQNNTSIPFFLPSEFKEKWTSLFLEHFNDCFENIWNEPYWLSHVVQDLFRIIYKHSKNLVQRKIEFILDYLNIKNIKKPILENYLSKFRALFQEHFTSVFEFTNENLEDLKKELIDISNEYENESKDYINFDIRSNLKNDLKSQGLKETFEIIFKLCIYMNLHDPLISLDIKDYSQRKIIYEEYNKSLFISIDGFKGNECIIIMNPPLLNNKHSYLGIKPAVFIISNEKLKCFKEKAKIENNTEENNSTLEKNEIEDDESHNLPFSKEKLNAKKNLDEQNKANADLAMQSGTINCFDHPLNLNKSRTAQSKFELNELKKINSADDENKEFKKTLNHNMHKVPINLLNINKGNTGSNSHNTKREGNNMDEGIVMKNENRKNQIKFNVSNEETIKDKVQSSSFRMDMIKIEKNTPSTNKQSTVRSKNFDSKQANKNESLTQALNYVKIPNHHENYNSIGFVQSKKGKIDKVKPFTDLQRKFNKISNSKKLLEFQNKHNQSETSNVLFTSKKLSFIENSQKSPKNHKVRMSSVRSNTSQRNYDNKLKVSDSVETGGLYQDYEKSKEKAEDNHTPRLFNQTNARSTKVKIQVSLKKNPLK